MELKEGMKVKLKNGKVVEIIEIDHSWIKTKQQLEGGILTGETLIRKFMEDIEEILEDK